MENLFSPLLIPAHSPSPCYPILLPRLRPSAGASTVLGPMRERLPTILRLTAKLYYSGLTLQGELVMLRGAITTFVAPRSSDAPNASYEEINFWRLHLQSASMIAGENWYRVCAYVLRLS